MQDNLQKRKKLRLQNFDYSTPGAYFITICAYDRKCILSDIVGAIHESPEIKLSKIGAIVDKIINHVPKAYPVTVEKYVIMPNHIHLIFMITNETQTLCTAKRSLISKIVGYIKMKSSKEIHLRFGNINIWQRGYHDHVIRDIADYEEISNYIHNNPIRWIDDRYYEEKR